MENYFVKRQGDIKTFSQQLLNIRLDIEPYLSLQFIYFSSNCCILWLPLMTTISAYIYDIITNKAEHNGVAPCSGCDSG